MDQSLVFIFSDQPTAQSFLDAAFALYAAQKQAEGYEFTDGVVIGKNAATGENMPAAQGTTKVGDVLTAPDGTVYVMQLPDDLIPQGYTYTVEAMPDSWVQNEADS